MLKVKSSEIYVIASLIHEELVTKERCYVVDIEIIALLSHRAICLRLSDIAPFAVVVVFYTVTAEDR